MFLAINKKKLKELSNSKLTFSQTAAINGGDADDWYLHTVLISGTVTADNTHVGFEINPKLWLATINQQSKELIMPNPSIMSLLDFAIKNNRIGESILLILIATDGKELNEFNPFFLQKIIQSLDRIGLGAKIKELTIETLVFKTFIILYAR